nr:MAG TPA: hypothetical protein [Siphovirus LN-2020-2]
MIGSEKVILRIGRGAKCIYDKTIFEEPVPFGFLTMSAPFVTVWLKKA